ncbi:MAG: nuclear transport factor 2 family protein [Bacteroidales bacterium]|nr:nuclear transport factor 2 family protein [Bacteroidales bacterium]
MRILIIILLSVVSLTVNAQNMREINETISKLFVASDNRDWKTVESIFADKVELDYSSMNGNPVVEITPEQITDSWKTILPGFESTYHQLGNFITEQNGAIAKVFCYGTATHYLKHESGNIWIVVGSYDLELKKVGDYWRVIKMKFNYKYQDGNTKLPQEAIKNVENKTK